jgi:hypothetical protein
MCWTNPLRLVIGRSTVRIPPRLQKPQVKAAISGVADCAAATGGHSFGWITAPQAHLPRFATEESVWLMERPSMGLLRRPTRKCGRRKIAGPAGRAHIRARSEKPTCGYAAIPHVVARDCHSLLGQLMGHGPAGGAGWSLGPQPGDAWVGCIVWSTASSSSAIRLSRSTWSRRRAPNASMILAASWRRRLKRRSTAV